VIPGGFYGYASVFAYLLLKADALTPAALLTPNMNNGLIAVVVAMIIGNVFGIASARLSAAYSRRQKPPSSCALQRCGFLPACRHNAAASRLINNQAVPPPCCRGGTATQLPDSWRSSPKSRESFAAMADCSSEVNSTRSKS